MSVNTTVKSLETDAGIAAGIEVRWDSFSLVMLTAPKGFIGCCIFAEEIIEGYGVPCAVAESGPGNPIGPPENMLSRTVMRANQKAKDLGIKVGMPVEEAIALLF